MRVVVGLIVNDKRELLVTQRAHNASFGGLWEFPGGKVEPLESDKDALIRELKEEIDLTITECDFLGEVRDDSRIPPVLLQVFRVDAYQGRPRCCIGQLDMKWLPYTHLPQYPFPVANQAIINLPNVMSYFQI